VEDRTVGLRRYGEDRDTRGVPLADAVAQVAGASREPA
jgi:hypothetical protein